jgi:hypothetical protein
MKATLVKERGYYDLYRIDEDGKKVTFASTEDYKQKLSKQNCDEIFWGLYDTEIEVEIDMDILNKYDQPKLDSNGCLILK